MLNFVSNLVSGAANVVENVTFAAVATPLIAADFISGGRVFPALGITPRNNREN